MTARAQKRKKERRRARRFWKRHPWHHAWTLANEYVFRWSVRFRTYIVRPAPALVQRMGYGGKKARSAARRLAGSYAVVTAGDFRALRAAHPDVFHLVDPEGQNLEACLDYDDARNAERRTA